MMDTYRDNLLTSSWLGEVVDVADPLKIGRVRVKVFGKFDELKTEDIPWATPSNSWSGGSGTGGGSFSVPKKGAIVAVQFNNGDLYHPEYRFNQNLSKEVKDLVKDSYDNAHVVIYDTVTDGGMKIYFTEKEGLMIDYKSTTVNIKPDNSISIKNPKEDSIEMTSSGNIKIDVRKAAKINCTSAKITAKQSIHLDCSAAASIKLGTVATSSIILGEPFLALFNSHVHIGNLLYPTTPPITPATPALLSMVSKTQ